MSRNFRFLIVITDYPEFLHWIYAQHQGLEMRPYEEQTRIRYESLFGVADFYSSNLRKLGHEAWDIHANNEFMQKAWAQEHRVRVEESTGVSLRWQKAARAAGRVVGKTPLRYLRKVLRPWLQSLDERPSWFYDILAAQIKHYRPDVLVNHDMGIRSRFLQEVKPYVRLLIGQHAATSLPDLHDWSCYDLIVSSFPPTVGFFRDQGVPAEIHRLGFEPKVLSCLRSKQSKFDVTFVGSLHSVHSTRAVFLTSMCARFPQMKVWGPGIKHLPASSPIRACYMGEAWGGQMYEILCSSKVTLNHHGDIPPYANNMRLFEATGVGSLLVTDWKKNLNEMFKEGEEVVAYRSPEECAELVRYYLEHDNERETTAQAGQSRTLREHTYYQRMQELERIVCSYL